MYSQARCPLVCLCSRSSNDLCPNGNTRTEPSSVLNWVISLRMNRLVCQAWHPPKSFERLGEKNECLLSWTQGRIQLHLNCCERPSHDSEYTYSKLQATQSHEAEPRTSTVTTHVALRRQHCPIILDSTMAQHSAQSQHHTWHNAVYMRYI